MITTTIIITIIISGIILFIALYNTIISVKNTVESSKHNIETYLQKRYDLIPNLISTVKKYMEHEKTVLENVTRLRNELKSNGGINPDKENMLSQTLKSLFAVAENYPDLKANENFIQLQDELTNIENEINAARRIFNNNLKILEDKKEMIPYNMIVGFIKIPEYKYFEAEEKAKENVNVNNMFNS